jgi:hypothetical protein
MPVGSAASRAVRRAEAWIYAPGGARRLAGARIGLCLLLAGRLARPMYLQLAGQPEPLFRPISFMRLFDAMPPASVVLVVQVVTVAAWILAAAGVWARPAMIVGWFGALLLNGMWTSVGQPMHNDTLPMLAVFPLLFAPVADAWSLWPPRGGRGAAGPSARYGWPMRTSMIVVAGGYFFSGFHKFVVSGPEWFLSGNIRWILYGISDQSPRPITPALALASHPLLAHLTAAASLAIELGFPIVLWRRSAAWLFVPGVVFLHLAIGLTMHLDYSAWAITVLVFFVPWDELIDRRRRASRVPVRRALARVVAEPARQA